jgi:hypothetical protein
MGATDYTENLLLTWLLTLSQPTKPTSWYLALFTSTATDAQAGTEISSGGYNRRPIQFAVTQTNGTTRARNQNLITFNANAVWGTITHIGIFDSSTGGNMLFYAELTPSRYIDNGDNVEILPNELKIDLQ